MYFGFSPPRVLTLSLPEKRAGGELENVRPNSRFRRGLVASAEMVGVFFSFLLLFVCKWTKTRCRGPEPLALCASVVLLIGLPD